MRKRHFILSAILIESKKEINLKNFSDEFYFVKVYDGEKYGLQKLIVEH